MVTADWPLRSTDHFDHAELYSMPYDRQVINVCKPPVEYRSMVIYLSQRVDETNLRLLRAGLAAREYFGEVGLSVHQLHLIELFVGLQ